MFSSRVHVGTRSRRQRNSHVACVLFDSSDEDDTPPRAIVKRQTTKRKQSDYCGSPTKRRKKHRQPAQQHIPTLNTRSSPKQLFSAMMVLSDRQKEAIKATGFMANSSTAEKNDDGTGGQTSIVDEWLQGLAALRSKIEKTLSDRLNLDPDNEDHRKLKRKYLEVLDVLPCLPDEGLETFEEGDMLNRTAGGSSSPPSALVGGIEQPAQDDTYVASDSGDKYEEGNLNVLITGIAKTVVEGDCASLGDVSLVSDTFPGTRGAAGGDDADGGADEPDVGNVGAVTAASGDVGYKEAESLQGVNHGEEQFSVDTQGTVSLGDNSQVDASVPAKTRVGGSDVESPANGGKSGNEKGPMNG
ncbi:hypothetical protein Hanom_Chr13g01226531 [Helianthus anomalus]